MPRLRGALRKSFLERNQKIDILAATQAESAEGQHCERCALDEQDRQTGFIEQALQPQRFCGHRQVLAHSLRRLADFVSDQNVQLKWPNDILHDDRKLAGVLCERIDKADLIGVGINANVEIDDAR